MQNPHDISDEILARLSNFAVGIVKREEGKGTHVLGSGTLANIDGRRGILTCGHVAELYEKVPEIGLVRFVQGKSQRRMIQLGDTPSKKKKKCSTSPSRFFRPKLHRRSKLVRCS
jgi:hypothetical protein